METGRAANGTDAKLPADELLTEVQSKQFLREQGIPVPNESLVPEETAAVDRAREFGSRLVLKVVSSDIPNRSEHQLVEVGVPADTVGETYTQLLDRARTAFPEASIDGILVQEYVNHPGAVE